MTNDSVTLADAFAKGVFVPEFAVTVPWLVTKQDLFSQIPEEHFIRSVAGWPQLKFTLLGFNATFAFNFVSDSDCRLVEIQYCNYHKRRQRRTFRKSARLLREALGTANLVNHPRGQLTWDNGKLRVESYLARVRRNGEDRACEMHMLSVSCFGLSRDG